ncbi:MAG: polysaccharide deacetylase family protein [Steroidobacteraceae bacterium]
MTFNMRWYVKKAARVGLSLLTSGSGSVALTRALAGGPRVRVLTYHRVGSTPRDPFCVPTADFDAQMRLLAEQGRAVSLQQVADFVAGAGTVPTDACLVAIDDGMLSTLTEILPVLERWGVPAVAYVTSSLVGREFEGLPERYLDWDELRRLAASGLVEIGSHAHTHRSLGLMPLEDARREASESRVALGAALGREVRTFAYPFGTRTDFSPQTDQALRDAGYSIAFNSVHGAIRRGMDPVSLPRVKIEGGESLAMFERVSRGAMDAWRVVDMNLWRLQRVRQEIA